ncbi:MAG TPA: hypothetical protein VKB86_05445 [Pyrinomonadaceae bacterium]|nr:hypothetical protein [Pyrinomonadaceae bacterium]
MVNLLLLQQITLLPIHIIAGAIGIVSGAVALCALKGATLHRKSGMIFVFAMLVMSSSAVVLAIVKLNRGNVVGGGLAFYMVTTALLTTRRRVAGDEWMDIAAMLLGLAVAITAFTFGFLALQSETGTLDGYTPPLYFIFGSIILLSVVGDIRMMVSRGLQGRRRITRHLWRMCFAMFIATGSFFLGQSKHFPQPLRIIPLLMILALMPLLFMLYWLLRVRFMKRHKLKGSVDVRETREAIRQGLAV